MDSPERNLTISAAEVQGSPLFNFLCSLSPIKPVKSVHVAQTFSEISFPPPPAVFVSPRIDAQKDSRSIQRNQSISRVEEVETGLGSCLVNARTEGRRVFLNSTLRVQRFGGVRKNDSTQKEHLFASPCSSPSKLVEEYLAEPVEDKLNTEGFSRMPPNSSTYESKINSGESIYKDVDRVDNLVGCTFAKQEVVDLAVMSKLSEGGGSDEAEAGLMEKTTYNFQAAQGLNPSNASSTLHLASQSSGGDKKVLDFDQDASDFEFLLSEEAGKLRPHACLDDWHTQTSSALSELSVEQVEGYIASLRQVNEEEQEKEVGLSIELAANFVADKSPVIDNLEAEPEAKGDQQGAAAYRANTPPQRGVRRRCLDFQVSEGQLKSKTGILSLRPMHANSSTRSEGVSSCDVEANVSLLVLRERASATFGATNSDSIQGLDACTQVCSREDGTASTKVTCANSSNLRLSRCLSLKNIDSQLVCATTRHSGTSPLPAGMLSGIGLHLNSLTGSSMQFSQTREIDGSGGSAASVKSANAFPGGTTCSRLQGSQAENTPNCFLPGNTGKHLYAGSTASFRQGLVVSLVEKTRMDGCEVRSESSDQVIISSKSTTCVQSVTLGIKQAEENVPSSGLEKRPSPLGQKRVLLPEFPHQRNLEGPEESSQSPRSPKKKRRSSSTAEKAGDGCKRCNCKKSKCLKLYCECFAAGVYCVDSCTCHDCFNKPEFEETVMETRQQIESRNPLAFAPKIIRAAETSPAKREDCHDTPASARHKRGCNCKKSHCLKKYCECYQAGVGCSDGCRCESCKNVYGMKEGAEDSEGKDLQVEAVEKEIVEEHIDTSDFCNKLTQGSQQQNNDLSPITPSFQYAGQNRTTIKLRPASKRRFPSDELHSPTFSLSSVKLSRSPSRLLRSRKGTQNSPPCASTEIPLPKVGSSPVSTPRILRFGQFSPRWEVLGDICTLTPLPQAPFRPTPASASVLDGADSSPSINGQHCYELSSSGTGSVRNSSKFTGFTPPMSQHQSSQSSVRCQTPVNTQGTPVTPMFASPACAMDNKSCYEESETFVHQFEGSVEEDGTPEFLKDLESGCSPVCLLNSSSPKHKRVSPPHHHALREASHRGLQSPGVRSGRKFILQSIPSVPPTPFPAVHEQSNGSRNCKAET